MLQLRISKYNPELRDSKGAYTNLDEWTGVCDIGVKTNLETYINVVEDYISAIRKILNESVREPFLLTEFEDSREHMPSEHYAGNDELKAIKFEQGMSLDNSQVLTLVKMALRELVWFKLENSKGDFIHSGYEMYIYMGITNPSDNDVPCNFGEVFIENYVSPYHE